MRVGFMTYDRKINFYNIKGNLSQPQQMTVGDVGDMFVPLVDGFMCNVEESEAVIDRYFIFFVKSQKNYGFEIFFREIASTSTWSKITPILKLIFVLSLYSLMEQIPLMFGETRETETVLGPVIQAGKEAFKVSIVIFVN